MHEYSVVSSLLDLCEKQAEKSDAKEIKTVTLKVGRLSGIEAHFMQSCFDTFKEDTVCHNAQLVMNIIEVEIYCKECKTKHLVLDNNFLCPKCKSSQTETLQGQELLVESIEILGKDI